MVEENRFLSLEPPKQWSQFNSSPVSPRAQNIYLSPYKWTRTEGKHTGPSQAADRNYKLKHIQNEFRPSSLPHIKDVKPSKHTVIKPLGKKSTEPTPSVSGEVMSKVYQKLHSDKNMDAPYMYVVRNMSKRGTDSQSKSTLPTIIPTFNIQLHKSFKEVLSEALNDHITVNTSHDDCAIPAALVTTGKRALTSEKPRRRVSSRAVKSQLSVEEPPVRSVSHPDSADIFNKHLVKQLKSGKSLNICVGECNSH